MRSMSALMRNSVFTIGQKETQSMYPKEQINSKTYHADPSEHPRLIPSRISPLHPIPTQETDALLNNLRQQRTEIRYGQYPTHLLHS
jgi:hypothetical protein